MDKIIHAQYLQLQALASVLLVDICAFHYHIVTNKSLFPSVNLNDEYLLLEC